MDAGAISGSSQLMRNEQTRQILSTVMMKQAASQQNQVADMLAGSVKKAVQTAGDSKGGFEFSTYA